MFNIDLKSFTNCMTLFIIFFYSYFQKVTVDITESEGKEKIHILPFVLFKNESKRETKSRGRNRRIRSRCRKEIFTFRCDGSATQGLKVIKKHYQSGLLFPMECWDSLIRIYCLFNLLYVIGPKIWSQNFSLQNLYYYILVLVLNTLFPLATITYSYTRTVLPHFVFYL
jgi:hypothetical protein